MQALATELLESIDDVFLDKIKVSPPKTLIDGKANDLARLMRAEVQEDGFRQAGVEILEDLRNALPASIRDVLAEDVLTELLTEAIDEVSLSLHRVDPQ